MENVYVLIDGEAYEGYSIVGVYGSLLRATEVAEGLMYARRATFNYRPEKPTGTNAVMCWADRSDYIEIQQRPVE